MKERERVEIDPFVKEMLLNDPDFVAWLALHDDEVDEDEHAAAA